MQWMPQRGPVSSPRGGPYHPARRRPGQRLELKVVVCPLQSRQGQPAAGIRGGEVTATENRGVKR